jgi:hypothetical protein
MVPALSLERHSTPDYSAAMPGGLAKHIENIARGDKSYGRFNAALPRNLLEMSFPVSET